MTSFDHALGEAHYAAYRPADVDAALDAAQAEALAMLAEVPGSAEPFASFDAATARFDFVAATAGELGNLLGGDWVAAAAEAARRAARFRTAIYQRADLHAALAAAPAPGPVEARLRADLLRRFERCGAHLAPAGRVRIAAIEDRLAELGSAFADNLHAVDRGLGYSDKRATDVLRSEPDARLRERTYRMTVARAAETNGPVVAEVLALRQEQAELLGYRDFVDLQRAGRMVADPQALLDELAAAYRPQAEREHADLLAFARETTGDATLELTAADVDTPVDGYWATRLRQARGIAATAQVRVPLDRAVEVMLEAFAELYTVTFTRSAAEVWDPAVEAYDLHDSTGRHLARIYCDWYTRDGKRPYGAWMSAGYVSVGDEPHLATVVTNVPGTEADLGDLRIMWHEFGHALHLAFTRTRYRLRAPDHMPHDFIEAPSRIMEYWVVDPVILARLGLPPDAADAVVATERFRAGSRKLVRLARPAIDLALHRGEDPRATKQHYLPVPVDPADETAAQFHHVFVAGYAGGHYAYQWAGVLAADLFTRFAAEGLLNPATGAAYVECVLAPGAERDPNELVGEFLGRPVSIDALLRRDGVR